MNSEGFKKKTTTNFKAILLSYSRKSKRQLDTTLKALERRKVNFEVRRLSVGDFLWICRDETKMEHEFVLPYIVERKRMDDLASSIKDGRFHEQKFRLSDCGLHNKIYLIENRGNNTHVGLPLTNLLQAATNTLVQNGFTVKFTDSNDDSMLYLTVMSNLLIRMYAVCVDGKILFFLLCFNFIEHFSRFHRKKIWCNRRRVKLIGCQ